MTKTHKAAETEWQHKVNREKSAGVFKVRELVHKSRAAQQQDAASRRDAKAGADAMTTRVRELEASLERLRGTRQQTLLDTDTIKEERVDFAEQTATYLAKITIVGGWVSPCAVSPLVVFPPAVCGGCAPLRSSDASRSFAFMRHLCQLSGIGMPGSDWQQSGRRGRAAAARITTSAETPAGTQASPQQETFGLPVLGCFVCTSVA